MTATLHAADLFCGAGGTSTGLAQAAARRGRKVELVAINHWQIAVDTHAQNHPTAHHVCASLEGLDPRKTAPGGRLDLLMASPECTHHSSARGGRPCNDQSRASAWHVLHWAQTLQPEHILVENVSEFTTWGPLGTNGRPLKRQKGETYAAWLAALRSLGYTVEARVLNAADFGEATTRRRLFVLARRGRKPPRWPQPTHAREPLRDLFGHKQKWRPAREVIDWTLRGRSIFDRARPLAPRTMARIAEGLRRFGGPAAEPFLAVLRGTGTVRTVDAPLPSLTAGGEHLGLVEPFIVPNFGEREGQAPRTHSLHEPLPAVTSHGAGALVEPFVLSVNHGNNPAEGARGDARRVRSIEQPLPTVTASHWLALAQPFILPPLGFYAHGGTANPPRSLDMPLQTITSRGGGHVVQPFVLQQQSGGVPRHVGDPLPTVAGKGAISLIEPMLMSYYGNAGLRPVSEPAATVTTKDRLALIDTDGAQLDILFRMLQPHELAAAMGFPADYRFAGTRTDAVKQIGNAVSVAMAEALCFALLEAA